MKIERFNFTGAFGRRATCSLQKLDLLDGRVVVIATELADNPGISVTNWAEHLATQVCQRLDLDARKLVWIEHYPTDPCPVCKGSGCRRDSTCRACSGRGTRRERASYDLVTFEVWRNADASFELTEPKWRPVQARDWDELGVAARSG